MATKKLNILINQKGATKATSQNKALGASIAGTIGKYVGLGVAITKVGSFLKDSIKLYGIQEQAEKKLATALGHTNTSLLKQASALQRMSKYGDETIIAMQALAFNMGISEAKLGEATRMAIGLSTALGVDLNMAMKAAAGAIQGDTNLLTRYIPLLKTTTDQTEKLAIVRNVANKGLIQSAADTKTSAGAIHQFSMAWGDFEETAGKALIENLELQRGVENLTGVLNGEIHFLAKSNSEWEGSAVVHHKATEETAKATAAAKAAAAAEKARLEAIEAKKARYDAYVKKIKDEAAALKEAAEFSKAYMQSQGLWKEQALAISTNIERMVPALKKATKVQETAVLTSFDNIYSDIQMKYMNIASMTNQLIGNSLISAFTNGENALEAFKNSFKRMLVELAVKMAVYGLINMFSGGTFGGLVGGLGGFLGFGKGRAEGGPVYPNTIYPVGEEGPELFVPETAGVIVPNSNGLTINFNGNITDRRYVQTFLIPEMKKAVQLGRV